MNTTKSLEEIMASLARQIKPQLVSDAEKETLEAERRKEERKDWAAQEYKKLEAPLRLRRQSDNLRHDGDWGSALGALKQKLGKGESLFFVAQAARARVKWRMSFASLQF